MALITPYLALKHPLWNCNNMPPNFCNLQMFKKLASDGNTTFSINIQNSCDTCYNMRLWKVGMSKMLLSRVNVR